MKMPGSRTNWTLAITAGTTLCAAPAARADLVPQTATYSIGGTSSAEGIFVSEVNADSFSGGQSQPSQAPLGAFADDQDAYAHWADPSFPSLEATGTSRATLSAAPWGPSGWAFMGTAEGGGSGDFFNGALGRGHAWSESMFTFTLTEASWYHLGGIVIGRSAALTDPTWTNFAESGTVELWQGTTLIHRAAGQTPHTMEAFSFEGTLPAGDYRLEARARARTESLAFGQPWGTNAEYQAYLTIPTAPAITLAVCAAPITLRRRR
ncbi:MAG: hypothetical protein U0637_02600 [Phycisphaerales bacterium]